MPITTDSQKAGVGKTTTQGVTVFETAPSTAIASSTNKIATDKLSSNAINVKGTPASGGVTVLAGVDIKTAFTSSGTVGTGATNTFSMHTAKATLEAALEPDPTITITSSSDNTVRTYTRNLSGEVGSFVIEFDEGAALAQTITVNALKPDGTTITRTFEGTAVGSTNGVMIGSNVGFAIWDTLAASDSAKSEDAAANLRAAMLSANGFGDAANGDHLDVYANVASEAAGAAIDLGKVCVYQRVPGTAGNTALTSTATAATTTIIGTAALDDEDGTNFILTNTDGTTVTFHTDPTKNFGDTSSDGGTLTWELNTRDIDSVRKATQALYIACKTAIDAGELKCTISPTTVDTIADETQADFTLTQTVTGAAGNTSHTLVTGVTASGETAFTGGIAFDDGLSTNVPANFTGGLATTHSHAAGEFNCGHSPQWAAYDLATLINDSANGSPGITAVSVNNRVTCTNTALGTIGNSSAISYNSTFPNITSVLPAGKFSGAVAPIPCNFGYEQSFDGVTWTSTTEVIADVAANVTGLKLATVNLPSAIAPYIRWVVNSNGGNLGSTSGIVSIKHTGG